MRQEIHYGTAAVQLRYASEHGWLTEVCATVAEEAEFQAASGLGPGAATADVARWLTTHWISLDLDTALTNVLLRRSADPRLMWRLGGRAATQTPEISNLARMVGGDVQAILAVSAMVNETLNAISEVHISERHAGAMVYQDRYFPRIGHITCDYTWGLLSAASELVGLPPMLTVETHCQATLWKVAEQVNIALGTQWRFWEEDELVFAADGEGPRQRIGRLVHLLARHRLLPPQAYGASASELRAALAPLPEVHYAPATSHELQDRAALAVLCEYDWSPCGEVLLRAGQFYECPSETLHVVLPPERRGWRWRLTTPLRWLLVTGFRMRYAATEEGKKQHFQRLEREAQRGYQEQLAASNSQLRAANDALQAESAARINFVRQVAHNIGNEIGPLEAVGHLQRRLYDPRANEGLTLLLQYAQFLRCDSFGDPGAPRAPNQPSLLRTLADLVRAYDETERLGHDEGGAAILEAAFELLEAQLVPAHYEPGHPAVREVAPAELAEIRELLTTQRSLVQFAMLQDLEYGARLRNAIGEQGRQCLAAGQEIRHQLENMVYLTQETNYSAARLDLRAEVEDALAAWEQLLTLHWEWPEEELRVVASSRELRIALLNLAANAEQAIWRQHGSLDPGEVTITARRCGSQVILSFADNGCGMDPDTVAGVWRMGFSRFGGQGIGLPIVAAILEKYGGAVDLTAAPGKGCTVVLRFGTEGGN